MELSALVGPGASRLPSVLCGVILLCGSRSTSARPAARVRRAVLRAGRRPGCCSVAGPRGRRACAVAFSVVARRSWSGPGGRRHLVLADHPGDRLPARSGCWRARRASRSSFNIAIALAVGVGFLISIGDDPGRSCWPDRPDRRASRSRSAIAIGFWISRIADLSEERRRLLDEPHRRPGRARGRCTGMPAPPASGSAWPASSTTRSRRASTGHGAAGTAARDANSPPARSTDATLELLESGARDALAETRVARRRRARRSSSTRGIAAALDAARGERFTARDRHRGDAS